MDIAEGEKRRQDLRQGISRLLPELRGFARFLSRDRTLADDLLQEALVRALGALDQFQPETSLKAWLFTILRNAFYEHHRKRRREAVLLDDKEVGELAEPSVMPRQEGQAAVRDLEQLIWTLSPTMREALILIGVQEMTYEEAALVCGVPVGTMKARLSRARAALAEARDRAETSSR